jgi:hypothetical protein
MGAPFQTEGGFVAVEHGDGLGCVEVDGRSKLSLSPISLVCKDAVATVGSFKSPGAWVEFETQGFYIEYHFVLTCG